MSHQNTDEPMNKVVALNYEDETMADSKSTCQWSLLLTELGQGRAVDSGVSDAACRRMFATLFSHFAPRVKAYILRSGLVESVAEELMQETMLLMWRKAHLYNVAKAAASTWIFTLARNQSIDWMRKQKYPEYAFDDSYDLLPDDARSDAGEQLVISKHLKNLISDLPENQAQVIYMSFYEGRAHAEIAERLGIPLGSVKSRIRLACEKIKLAWRDV